jgi:hypothetical protein
MRLDSTAVIMLGDEEKLVFIQFSEFKNFVLYEMLMSVYLRAVHAVRLLQLGLYFRMAPIAARWYSSIFCV